MKLFLAASRLPAILRNLRENAFDRQRRREREERHFNETYGLLDDDEHSFQMQVLLLTLLVAALYGLAHG